ncbi:MAG TPA: hypothetical protein VND42_02290 [Candidatus Acidoferrales bacterium]|nr:hypothetical protein [Candidatus Acidoferrales bacterium]
MAGEQRRDFKLATLLSAAGLLSASVTICGASATGQSDFLFFPGIVFGVIISGCFIVSGALRSPRRAILFIVACTVANLLAVWLGIQAEIWLPLGDSSVGHGVAASPVALFASGLFGAVVVVSSAVTQLHPEIKLRDLDWKVFSWPALGGVLGIGWELGPTLGMALSSAAHALGPAPRAGTAPNTAGEMSHRYSLWLVWQTGVAFILGIVLRRYEVKPGSRAK